MKILIMADMEGASGIDDYRTFGDISSPLYEKGRLYMTEDVNAAICGLKMGGATEVHVVDGHGTGQPPNLIHDKIESGAKLLGGAGSLLEMTRSKATMQSYDAFVLVCQHSMAGTLDGFLSHSNTRSTALRVNGKFVGEIEELAWLAGYFNVPTVLVTGDAAAVREAKAFLPGIEGVIVKTATARDKVECLPLDEARSLIQEVAFRVLKNLRKFKPFKPSPPVHIDVVFASPEQAKLASVMPRSKQTDDRTVSYTAEDYLEALSTYFTAIGLSGSHWQNAVIGRLMKLEGARKVMQDLGNEMTARWATEPPPFPSIKY